MEYALPLRPWQIRLTCMERSCDRSSLHCPKRSFLSLCQKGPMLVATHELLITIHDCLPFGLVAADCKWKSSPWPKHTPEDSISVSVLNRNTSTACRIPAVDASAASQKRRRKKTGSMDEEAAEHLRQSRGSCSTAGARAGLDG